MKRLYSFLVLIQSKFLTLLIIYSVSIIFLSAVMIVHFWKGVSIGALTRDPLAVLNGAVYIGFLSQIGIFLWSASAAICLFTTYVLKRISDNIYLRNFLLMSGLISFILGIDDIFLLHEEIYPYIGIQEKIILLSYALIILVWLVHYRNLILTTDYVLLGNAFLFFSFSILVDLINPKISGVYLFEDGAKFVGIVSWLAYFFHVSANAIHCSNVKELFKNGRMNGGFTLLKFSQTSLLDESYQKRDLPH